jgi:hypothetical protein
LAGRGPLVELVHDYCRRLHQNGLFRWKDEPYTFGRLHDGTRIADCMRRYYRDSAPAQERAGADPFAHDHAYLNEPALDDRGILLTRLMHHVWESRPDVRRAFPFLSGRDRSGYALWFINDFAPKQGVPDRFVDPIRRSLAPSFARRGARFVARRVLPASWLQRLRNARASA